MSGLDGPLGDVGDADRVAGGVGTRVQRRGVGDEQGRGAHHGEGVVAGLERREAARRRALGVGAAGLAGEAVEGGLGEAGPQGEEARLAGVADVDAGARQAGAVADVVGAAVVAAAAGLALTLAPGAAGTIKVTFGKSYGGNPGFALDPARVVAFKVYATQPKAPATVIVRNLRAVGP